MDSATLTPENLVDSQIDVNSILAETEVENESDLPEISVDELLERATAQTLRIEMENNVRAQKPETAQPVVIHTLDESTVVSDSIVSSSNAPISVHVESDDDVIFVGEQNMVINLCSPDTRKSSNAKTTSTRLTNKKSNLAVSNGPDPDKNSVICAVCMDSSVGRKPHTTTCGHIFCEICIKQAIKVTKKCPLCNKSLTQKNIIPVFI